MAVTVVKFLASSHIVAFLFTTKGSAYILLLKLKYKAEMKGKISIVKKTILQLNSIQYSPSRWILNCAEESQLQLGYFNQVVTIGAMSPHLILTSSCNENTYVFVFVFDNFDHEILLNKP